MNVGILGTGVVGRAHAEKLSKLGHQVVLGTQSVEKTLASKEKDVMGSPPFSEWHKEHGTIKLMTFAEAAAYGEIIYDALRGDIALSVLTALKQQLTDKILVDIANPLDFSKGMPPSLFVCNTDSLGEQIQEALPNTHVVKTLNTTNAFLQVDPTQLANGDHHIFVSGNDDEAKAKVKEILKSYGWKNIIDLGEITTARGTEMLLPLWLRLWGALKNPMFNFKIVQ
jgi:predicted dinucleotide-binding enzyme